MSLERGKAIKIAIITTIICVFLALVFILVGVLDKNYGLFPEQEQKNNVLEYDGEEYVLKSGVETFLVMGLDKMEQDITENSYNNNQQADFLMLMVFDNEAKTYSTIHINRDTMADIDVLGIEGNKVSTVKKQIALAHTYGKGGSISNSNTAKAVSQLLYGVKVNHYMSLTLDSIPVMNELVDGVTLEVLDDFSGIEGADALKKGETVTLTPEQAQLYVQHRRELEDSSNSTRMQRQQQYLKAMREQIVTRIETDKEFLANAVIKMADYMDSDCSTTRLEEIGKKMQDYTFVEISEIEGTSIIGSDEKIEFYPDENALKKVVIDLFYVKK